MTASFNGRQRALAAVAIAASVAAARADTTVAGSALAYRSSGSVSGSTVTLSQNGYLGTYVRLAAPGTISLNAVAGGTASNGVNPNLTFSIADAAQSFAVAAANNAYAYTSPVMPAGTYFVRAQLDNHETVRVNGAPVVANTTLALSSLTVGANATVLNAATDANARAAADTYIENFRKGDASIRLAGAAPGAQVHVQLRNNAFKLGTYVSGFSSSDSYLRANPTAGSDAQQFQSFVNGRFNAIVPANAGKWASTETITLNGSGNVSSQFQTMGTVDQMMAYAKAHDMVARQHNLIWGNQQPAAVQTWVTDAASGSATAAASLAKLNNAITNRINYYVKTANSLTGQPRASAFAQLDVLNEALQTGPYFKALGYAGIANVYRQTQDAVAAVGAPTRLYTNEYNVLQNAPITVTPSATYGGQAAATYGDAFANWYRQEIEGINNAGATAGAAGDVVTGIGVQYYPTVNGTRGPNVIQGALQNLSVAGLPISLTEFGGQTSIARSDAPLLVDDTIRMMMGTPAVDSMLIWGWYDQDGLNTDNYGDGTALINKGWKNADGTYNLTAAGVRFEYLFGRGLDPTAPGANADGSNPNPWTTDLTTSVNADGTIDLHGFYGDYDVTVGGKAYALTLEKGVASYAIQVPEPATMLSVSALTWIARRKRISDGASK